MLGVAGTMRIKVLEADMVNRWLEENSDLEIIDMKFASSATDGEWYDMVMIIYTKE